MQKAPWHATIQAFPDFFSSYVSNLGTLVILFCQTEIVLKDSTAFVYVTQSEKSSH